MRQKYFVAYLGLDRFMKTQHQKNVSWFHRYILKISNIGLSQNFLNHEFSTIWLIAKSADEEVTSDYIHPK